MKFEIYRTDTGKRVVQSHEFRDAEAAAGEYSAILMLAGILPMNENAIQHVSDEKYCLSNGWTIEVRPVL